MQQKRPLKCRRGFPNSIPPEGVGLTRDDMIMIGMAHTHHLKGHDDAAKHAMHNRFRRMFGPLEC